jgi:hypothetical protein
MDAQTDPADASSDAADADGGTADAGDISPDDCNTPDAPEVVIVSPLPASDPYTDPVVIGDRVVVRCEVTRPATADSRPVDSSSISIVRLGPDGQVASSPAVTSEDGAYRATFHVGALDNGPVRFRCTAQDTASEPRCGMDEVGTLLDLGPRVDVVSPGDGSIHATRMTLTYRVSPEPVAAEDPGADVASHQVTVAGVVLSHDLFDEDDGELTASLDFEDRAVFPEPLSGELELSVSATNTREPEPATRTVTQTFTIDTTGPSIAFVAPLEGAVVGGRVRVAADISDPSGVDPDTVILRIGATEYDMRHVENDRFEVFFDAADFSSSITELTLNVTAADNVGNRRTVSRIVKLDSRAPIAHLDPPDVREGAVQFNGALHCSTLFDPVGGDAVNDGEVAGEGAVFRARVQDLGNGSLSGSGNVTFLAGVDHAQLYLLDDSSLPLLIDSNGDGTCDAINPAAEPDPGDPSTAIVIDLVPISQTGQAYFSAEGDVTANGSPHTAYDGIYSECTNGNAQQPPQTLCSGSTPMTRVIPAPQSGQPPAIYVKPPITSLTCVGDGFDFQGALSPGWACLAVRAEDGLGNVGVSPPLRVCFEGEGTSACPASVGSIVPAMDRPSCTDGCALPPSFHSNPAHQLVIPVN